MTTETTLGTLAAALAELQTKLPAITKDLTAKVEMRGGGSYRYTYADLARISREVLPILGELGLSFTSRPTLRDGRFVLAYELMHVSGDSLAGEYPLPEPNRGTPQEMGSAITYARRYCLCAVTGVAPEDDDNDAALAEKAAQRNARKQTKGGIDSRQQLKMQQLFRTVGMTDRDEKLRYAQDAVKRELGSATELTHAEADKVIAKLESWAAQQQPPAGGDA